MLDSSRDEFLLVREFPHERLEHLRGLRLAPLADVARPQPVLGLRCVDTILLGLSQDLLVNLDSCVQVAERFLSVDGFLQ